MRESERQRKSKSKWKKGLGWLSFFSHKRQSGAISYRRSPAIPVTTFRPTPPHQCVSSQRQLLSRWCSPTDLLYLHCTAGHLRGTRKQHSEKECRGVRGMVGDRENRRSERDKGMNSSWAFWGIAALLRLARLATGWKRKACPLPTLVIQELVDRLYQII